jgi:putative hydrolase of HD superfamily
MTEYRLEQQIQFILEIDKLKTILRRTRILHEARHENSAEHSWHLAVMATVLSEHAEEPVDVTRVVELVLVHDIVEIDAGDTFCYDTEAVVGQAEREQQAADRLFGLLPQDQQERLRQRWEEFEARETPEARFAHAIDRIMPLLHNYHNGGGSWRQHGVTREQVLQRMAPVRDGSERLWRMVERMIGEAVDKGMLPASTPEKAP